MPYTVRLALQKGFCSQARRLPRRRPPRTQRESSSWNQLSLSHAPASSIFFSNWNSNNTKHVDDDNRGRESTLRVQHGASRQLLARVLERQPPPLIRPNKDTAIGLSTPRAVRSFTADYKSFESLWTARSLVWRTACNQSKVEVIY